MELWYVEKFIDCTGFEGRDRAALREALSMLGPGGQATLLDAAERYTAAGYRTELLDGLLSQMEPLYGVHRYTLWLLVLILCSKVPYDRCGDEKLFWDTFTDIRYKVQECRRVYGICGVFVGFWYPIFFTDSIVKLGRLEFETSVYPGKAPVSIGDYRVGPGDISYSIHIPASGEPFTREARLDAYRRAYDHFGCAQRGTPLVCWCESWLLYPPYAERLPEGSRIKDFSRDFLSVTPMETPVFDDFWRVFPGQVEADPASWEGDSGLQRAIKSHFLSGGKPGCGLGLLIFDGEHLLQKEQAL